MKAHWFHILLSLADEPRYGSAIQDDVRALSGGSVRLWPATLYGSLEELLERGWISELDGDEEPDGRHGRERYYRLSPQGRRALEEEVLRLEGLTELARTRLGGAS